MRTEDLARENERLRHALSQAWRVAWRAQPLPEHPVLPADRAAFNYGRDCASAAVRALILDALKKRPNEDSTHEKG